MCSIAPAVWARGGRGDRFWILVPPHLVIRLSLDETYDMRSVIVVVVVAVDIYEPGCSFREHESPP